MIKAEYLGVNADPLQSGRVYRITTKCKGNKLIVTAKGAQRYYPCLEEFLKEWKVRAVYHGDR